MSDPILVDVVAAAELLGISERHLGDLTRAGEVPCVRLGGSVRYSPDALRRWAVERSGYDAAEEVDDASKPGRGKAVHTEVGRAIGRGRPRRGGQAPIPLRRDPAGGHREA